MPRDDTTRISVGPPKSGSDENRPLKARLVFEKRMGKPVQGEFITLLFGSQLLIGRDPACEIFIDDDRVSRKHALIRIDSDVVRLSDLGSTNGTTRNKLKLNEEIILQSGDNLNFGQARTYEVRIVERNQAVSSVRLASQGEGLLLMPQEMIIGHALPQNQADLMIYDPAIKKQHARIEFFAGQTFIIALDPNGEVRVNDNPIREFELGDNYIIDIGETRMRFERPR